MILPKDLLSGLYTKPEIFLCETDKTKIGKLETLNLNGTFKFNAYSEISLGVPRSYNDLITGETMVNPYYDDAEALRLLYMPGFGYFEIQNPEINSDGVQEIKTIEAYSLEYTLSQKYLVDFVINTPDNEMNIGGGTPSSGQTDPLVKFYDISDTSHSLLHLALKKAYGWTIGHVDDSLKTQTRSFEISRSSIYDFLMNEVAPTYKCYFIFNTVNNTVSVYAETASVKFYGDGTTTTFILPTPFSLLGNVMINGYKTTEYTYNSTTGVITFTSAPTSNAVIEIEDGAMESWNTDVFVSFENLASEMKISYSADDIKTVLKVTGSDDMDISDVNLGLNYIMDLSYYRTVDWMGQNLYDAYNTYIALVNQQTPIYTGYLSQVNDLWDDYYEIQNKTSTDLTALKLSHFKTMLQYYYKDGNITTGLIDGRAIQTVITEDFTFLGGSYLSNFFAVINNASSTISQVESATNTLLAQIWSYYGITMLQANVDSYTNIQQTHIDSGWSMQGNENYYMYWANYMMLSNCQTALQSANNSLTTILNQITPIQTQMNTISQRIAMDNPLNFTSAQLTRLSAFLREDEYNDDNFLITDNDTNSDVIQAKKELLQCGKIELANLCQPKLSFSASLANLYALEEFAPIVNQFQLGNMVKVALRSDYIKKARLMEVHLNFEDFSDFSCEFGDLVSTKSPADIHADLLSKAAQAGKAVASNSSYWDKGADLANRTDIRLQNGLLDANTRIKAIDGGQNLELDQWGLHCRKVDPVTGEVDPKQAWLVNNLLCFTSDNWKTTKTGIGEFQIDGQSLYGVLSDAILSGYIEGSRIRGGTIQIGYRQDGDYNFEVESNGTVTFRGGSGAAKQISDLQGATTSLQEQVSNIEEQKMYRVEVTSTDRNIITNSLQTATLNCKVYSWDEDITSSLSASLFNWVRSSNNAVADATWNSTHTGMKSITIDISDITNSASFSCQVSLPNE